MKSELYNTIISNMGIFSEFEKQSIILYLSENLLQDIPEKQMGLELIAPYNGFILDDPKPKMFTVKISKPHCVENLSL